MNSRALTVRSEVGVPVEVFLARSQDLGFQLRMLGESNAPIFPQQVGDWWLEPLTPETPLPPRAARRLAAVLKSGLVPRAIVIFHELSEEPVHSIQLTAAPRRSNALDLLAQRAKERAPVVGAFLGRIAVAGFLSAARVTSRATATARRIVSDARKDPCLVIVTQDGQWIELDRWYS